MRRPLLALCVCLLALATASVAGATTTGPVDPYRYDYAHHCYKHPAKGALALAKWLEHNSRGVFWGIMRCEKLNKQDYSLHSEGRAVDWHPASARAAQSLIDRLLATDSAGNEHALARRMGVQEIIWNCHSWWSGPGGMGPYSYCYDKHGKRKKHLDPTLAHMNHVHLGLNLKGARMQTSFWQR